MRFVKNPSLWLLLIILSVGLMACDPEPTEEPPAVPPSITLKPPFLTQTPVFTATLTPSNTPEPTDVPDEPSPTPTVLLPTSTPSLTPTEALSGSILSISNVNIRTGPSTNFDVVVTAVPNTDVNIVGSGRNTASQIWYYISFVGDDGETYEGWIASTLIDSFDQDVPTLAPTPTETPEGFVPTEDPNATDTPEPITPTVTEVAADGTEEPTTPDATQDPEITPTATVDLRDVSDVNVLARCRQDRIAVAQITTEDTVSIWWRWWVTRPELMEQHLENVTYEVLLDGEPIEDYNDYQTEMRQDPTNLNRWTVFWYVPVGTLEAGEHTVEYRATWEEQIFDGISNYGPGSGNNEEETGDCTFTVIDLSE